VKCEYLLSAAMRSVVDDGCGEGWSGSEESTECFIVSEFEIWRKELGMVYGPRMFDGILRSIVLKALAGFMLI
jgi:hypothetical protein